MTSQLQHRLTAIFDRLQVTSPTSFVLAGQTFQAPFDSRHPRLPTPDEAVRQELAKALYLHGYARPIEQCAGGPQRDGSPQRDGGPQRDAAAFDPGFTRRLSQANQSHGGWDRGWRVYAFADNGELHVQKGLQCRLTAPGFYALADRREAVAQLGSLVELKRRRDADDYQPGYYLAFGDVLPDKVEMSNTVRFYFHATSQLATELLAHLSDVLNHYTIPFCFKCLADPAAYERTDACVLYVTRRHFSLVLRLLAGLPLAITSELRSATPLFTKALAAGIGLAEDPGSGESFGQHRCGLLAESVLDTHRRGEQSAAARLEAVRDRFATAGLDLEKPHLNAGSAELEVSTSGRNGFTWTACGTARLTRHLHRFLDVADGIGCRLARDAVWAAGRCNWIGVRWEGNAASTELVAAAHGPGLLEGTAGIGLFLARLSAQTGDAEHERTALGALRQALQQVEQLDAAASTDFYCGPFGIALASLDAAAELRDDELHDHGWQVVESLLQAGEDPSRAKAAPCSVAATLVGLSHLASSTGRDDLLQFAVRLGDQLLGGAMSADSGCRWPCSALHVRPNELRCDASIEVTRALLELYSVTQEPRFYNGAASAIERISPPTEWSAQCGQVPAGSASVFCFDGPIRAQTWLRCCELAPSLTGDPPSQRRLPRVLPSMETADERNDFTLGTGWAGRCDFLLTAAATRGSAHLRQTAEAIGDYGIGLCAQPRVPWPCLNGTDETYNLVAGQAGIGSVYLRLHDPKATSCLHLAMVR